MLLGKSNKEERNCRRGAGKAGPRMRGERQRPSSLRGESLVTPTPPGLHLLPQHSAISGTLWNHCSGCPRPPPPPPPLEPLPTLVIFCVSLRVRVGYPDSWVPLANEGRRAERGSLETRGSLGPKASRATLVRWASQEWQVSSDLRAPLETSASKASRVLGGHPV